MVVVTINELKILLRGYKTINSQKAFLTREIKALEELLTEYRRARAQISAHSTRKYGYYLGDKIYPYMVTELETHITEVELLRKSL